MKVFLLFFVTFFVIFCDANKSNYKRLQLTCGQIRHFVDGHNFRRQKIAQGSVPGQPPASDMMYTVWDEELAEKATKWSENGLFSHNPDRTIGSQRWPLVGENIYKTRFYTNLNIEEELKIEEALNSWFNEHKKYNYGPFSQEIASPAGHYTQMIWANSTRVGCGISRWKENGLTITLFVCDYGPTGNYIDQHPYTSSSIGGFLHCPKGECAKPYGPRC